MSELNGLSLYKPFIFGLCDNSILKPLVSELEVPLQKTNLPPLVLEISGSTNIIIMQNVKIL